MGRKKRKDSNKYNYSYKRSNTNQPKLNWAFLHDTALFIWFDHEQKKKKKKGRKSFFGDELDAERFDDDDKE